MSRRPGLRAVPTLRAVLGAALLGALLSGCAVLAPPSKPQAAAATDQTAGAAADAPATGARWAVRVEAPDRLAALLQQHLDIARLPALAGDEPVPDAELSRLLDATPTQVRELLQTEGFFAPQVRLARERDEATAGGAAERIRVIVEPGPRTRIGRVDIDVVGEAAEAAAAGDPAARALLQSLRDGWGLPAGAGFRNDDWSAAKAALLTRLRSAGHAAAAWLGTAAEVTPEEARARLFVVADSGPLFRAGPLQVEGLVHHDADTVGHIAGFGPGKPLTEELLLDFQDRLRQTGLYDRIDIGFEPDPAQAAATPVRVRLGESPRQVWTLGLGYSANVGPRVSAEHLHRRLFGAPLVSRNKAEWARLRQAWDGELATHPGPRLWRWLLGGSIERLEGGDDIVLSQRMRLGRSQNGARIDRLLFVEAERSSRRNLVQRDAAADSTELAVSGNLHGVWRRLDDAILPTRGWSLSLQTGFGRAHGTRSDSGWFSRLYGRLTWYQPLPADWYAQARLEMGQVFRPDGVAVPDSQQFRAGGDDSVRGYAYRSLGPVVDGAVDSGDALATASLELARPLSRRLPSVWGAVFVDAGNAATSFGQWTPAVGAGVGLRWRSPVGPLRLDWAYGRELRQGRLHFSVGITF